MVTTSDTSEVRRRVKEVDDLVTDIRGFLNEVETHLAKLRLFGARAGVITEQELDAATAVMDAVAKSAESLSAHAGHIATVMEGEE